MLGKPVLIEQGLHLKSSDLALVFSSDDAAPLSRKQNNKWARMLLLGQHKYGLMKEC